MSDTAGLEVVGTQAIDDLGHDPKRYTQRAQPVMLTDPPVHHTASL